MDGKIIRDPVHGYISVEKRICERFIDTKIFQRLRFIEQTSMRWLFPGGRHDRFVHSLGVYHLAVQVFEALTRNSSSPRVKEYLKSKGIRETFVLAALMHDCGHAPFSHTTEFLYNKFYTGEYHGRAYALLHDAVGHEHKADFEIRQIGDKPADHEAMSALIVLRCFSDVMRDDEFKADPDLAARMITGILFSEPDTVEKKIANILIGLINGKAIDVDKLDYIMRDTWASGIENTSVDIGRLLGAATITDDGGGTPVLSFNSTAISVIQTVIDARNHLYEWVYGHHTPLYYAELQRRLCVDLAKKLSSESDPDGREALASMFSVDALTDECGISVSGEVVVGMNDSDLASAFKRHCLQTKSYDSYFGHSPAHVPLWKSEAEYRIRIAKRRQYAMDKNVCARKIREKFGFSDSECFAIDGMSAKVYDIEESAVNVSMSDGKIHPFTDLVNPIRHVMADGSMKHPFFYLFIPRDRTNQSDEVVETINSSCWT